MAVAGAGGSRKKGKRGVGGKDVARNDGERPRGGPDEGGAHRRCRRRERRAVAPGAGRRSAERGASARRGRPTDPRIYTCHRTSPRAVATERPRPAMAAHATARRAPPQGLMGERALYSHRPAAFMARGGATRPAGLACTPNCPRWRSWGPPRTHPRGRTRHAWRPRPRRALFVSAVPAIASAGPRPAAPCPPRV